MFGAAALHPEGRLEDAAPADGQRRVVRRQDAGDQRREHQRGQDQVGTTRMLATMIFAARTGRESRLARVVAVELRQPCRHRSVLVAATRRRGAAHHPDLRVMVPNSRVDQGVEQVDEQVDGHGS